MTTTTTSAQPTTLDNVEVGQSFYFVNQRGIAIGNAKIWEMTHKNSKNNLFECDHKEDRKIINLSSNKRVIVVY